MATFAVTTRYVEARNDERLAARPDHRAWLTRLHDDGRLVNAGPFADESGALLIFSADSADDLHALLEQDPYPAGSVEYTVLGEWKHLFPFA